jgi:O-antigen/teichoic acid export membrane protein
MTETASTLDAPRPPSAGRAVSDIARQIAGRLVNGLLGVVVAVLVARGLGQDGFGRWSTLLAVVALATPLTELGMQQVAVARAAARPDQEAPWLGALVGIRLALGAAASLICLVAVLLISDDGEMRLTGALLCGTVMLASFGAFGAVFQLRVRNDLSVLVMTANSVVWTTAVIVVAARGGGLVPLGASFLGASAVTAVLTVGMSLRRARVSFAAIGAHSRELMRVGLPLTISGLLVLAYARIDQVIVFSYAGERGAGLYGAATRILDQAVIVPLSITTTLFPILVAAGTARPERMRSLLQHALEVLMAVALGALAFAIACGGPALGLLFGHEFSAAGTALAILMGVFLVTCLGYLTGSVVLIFELQKRYVRYAATGLVVNVALNLIFVPSHGYLAAAWITLVTELVVVGLTARACLRALAWRPHLGVLLRAALAAAVTCVALEIFQHAGTPIGVLLAETPFLYGALLVATGGLRLRESIAMVRGPRA